jgi:ATP-dependent helicase HrpB
VIQNLPIDAYIDEILKQFTGHQNLVLVAEPGAGKTTRVPPALLEISEKKILVLEPRRMAAVAAASRIAEERQWQMGQEIGYQVRFDSIGSEKTRLLFMTEALLGRRILQDPALTDVDIVVLDEFHERSQHVDLALGLLKEAQELGSKVKVLVMSATLNADSVSQFLNDAPIVRVPGRSFPLDIRYDKYPLNLRADDSFYKRLIEKIKEAQKQSKSDVLVFLPGVGEINKTERLLEGSRFQIDILHGSLSLSEQRKVLQKSEQPRVILSTNIAESSVTINGVDTVVDSGLNKINSWNPDTGFDTLSLSRISRSSADQRAGRAARQAPGICYRLWNEQDNNSMKSFTEAEILRTDLSEALLWLSFLGVTDASHFSWYEAPPSHHIEISLRLLKFLEAVDKENRVTEKGRKLLKLPLSTRAGCFFLEAAQAGYAEAAADLTAILQERDFWSQQYNLDSFHESHENDLYLRYEMLNQLKRQRSHAVYIQTLVKVSQQLQKLAGNSPGSIAKADQVRIWALKSFPDRVCRRRIPSERRALMATGRGVELEAKSQVKKSEFFVALQGIDLSDKETRIGIAVAVSKEDILKTFPDRIEKKRELKQDEKSEKIVVEEFKAYLKLPLEKPVVRSPSAEEVQSLLPEIVLNSWDRLLKENDGLSSWWSRLAYYFSKKSDMTLSNAKSRLAPFVEEGCYGLKSWNEVVKQDWIYFLEKSLEPEVKSEFHKFVPSHIQVGNRTLGIQYQEGQDPFIESRIQNFYGLKKHPSIWNGQIPLRLILLGPHGRPIQITKDIVGFWKSSYPEIRKEMKADYPKHSWPEDPSA